MDNIIYVIFKNQHTFNNPRIRQLMRNYGLSAVSNPCYILATFTKVDYVMAILKRAQYGGGVEIVE